MKKRLLSLLLALLTVTALPLPVMAAEPEARDAAVYWQPTDSSLQTGENVGWSGTEGLLPSEERPWPNDGGLLPSEERPWPGKDTYWPSEEEQPGEDTQWPDEVEQPGEETQRPDEEEQPSQEPPAGVSLISDAHTAYLEGDGKGFFNPKDDLTRAQAAQILLRLLPEEARAASAGFADVKADAWYAEAASVLGGLGALRGGMDTFAPSQPISRGEFFAAVTCFFPMRDDADQFSDIPADHPYAAQILSARAHGWLTGYGDDTVQPDKSISRVDAVAFLNRALGRSADESYVDRSRPVCFYWDVLPESWYYYDVMEASVSHQHEKGEDGGERWLEHTPVPFNLPTGKYLIDGWQYHYDASTGTIARDTTVDGFTYDGSGHFTSGSAELDGKLREIVLAHTKDSMTQEEKLRALYVYTRDSFTYLRRPAYEFGATGFMLKDALDMLNTGYGNCYSYASVFWYLSRWIGYDAKIYSGTVGRERSPHSWVEIVMDGKNYIFDTELEMAYHRKGQYDVDLYKYYYDGTKWFYVKP